MPKRIDSDDVHMTSLRLDRGDYEGAREIIEKLPGQPNITSFLRGVIRDVRTGEYINLNFLTPEFMVALKNHCKRDGITIQQAIEPMIRDAVRKLREADEAARPRGRSKAKDL